MSSLDSALSQQRALNLLQSLGWQLLSADEVTASREDGACEVLLPRILKERLRAINSFEHNGTQHRFDEQAIETGAQAIARVGDVTLGHANEKIWRLLRFGTSVIQSIAGNPKTFTAQYVDWQQPANNAYHAVADFEIESVLTGAIRTVDVVLFVNGIPWVVIECKDTATPAAEPTATAVNDQLQNHSEREIPQLFRYTQLLLAAEMDHASYGTVGTSKMLWGTWRERDEDAVTINRLISERPAAYEQDHLIHALCRPARLLELARTFTFFESGVRRLARDHQYFAVRALLERVSNVSADGKRSGGVIWQAAGSGKSMTLIMAAHAILEVFQDYRPRVVLVSDRAVLDSQLYQRLGNSGIACRQAGTGRELLELLQSPQVRVITTLVQKFDAAVKSQAIALDSPDIFVLIDEAERSQTGQLHASMRHVLPRACFVGFTSTPPLRTAEMFGDIIGRPYTFDQAIRDHAIVPVLYEARGVGTDVDTMQPAQNHHEVPGSEDFIGALEVQERIKTIATDIGRHFKTHFSGTGLKGLLVASTQAAALSYKRHLDEQHLVTSEVSIFLDPRLRHTSPDPLNEFQWQVLRKFGSVQRYEQDVLERFSNAQEPELLIVVERLSGLDVPRNSVLYLTRVLETPALTQAIARVNRPWQGKQHGLMVDYCGLNPDALHALNFNPTENDAPGPGPHDPPNKFRHSKPSSRPPHRHPQAQPDVTTNAPEPAPRAATACEAYRRMLHEVLDKDGRILSVEVADELGARIHAAILARRRVDWKLSADVQNRMKTAIEDVLFEMCDTHGIDLDFPLIDTILDRSLEIARREVP